MYTYICTYIYMYMPIYMSHVHVHVLYIHIRLHECMHTYIFYIRYAQAHGTKPANLKLGPGSGDYIFFFHIRYAETHGIPYTVRPLI